MKEVKGLERFESDVKRFSCAALLYSKSVAVLGKISGMCADNAAQARLGGEPQHRSPDFDLAIKGLRKMSKQFYMMGHISEYEE